MLLTKKFNTTENNKSKIGIEPRVYTLKTGFKK